MNTEQLPAIPERMKHLKLFHGLPIPFNTFVNDEGVPDFKITDDAAWKKCAKRRLCGICGQPLGVMIYFIGGEKSLDSGAFFDPPMHEDCARYSFAVCPFLAAKKDYAATIHDPQQAGLKLQKNMVSDKRPKLMGILSCAGYIIRRMTNEHGEQFFFEAIGRREIEWKDGV